MKVIVDKPTTIVAVLISIAILLTFVFLLRGQSQFQWRSEPGRLATSLEELAFFEHTDPEVQLVVSSEPDVCQYVIGRYPAGQALREAFRVSPHVDTDEASQIVDYGYDNAVLFSVSCTGKIEVEYLPSHWWIGPEVIVFRGGDTLAITRDRGTGVLSVK